MEYEIVNGIFVNEIFEISLRTSIIFVYAFTLLRLLGKGRLSHFGYIDLLLVIAFGSAVGDVMIYGESTVHLIYSMVAITVVTIWVKVLNEISSHSTLGNHIVDGHARLLVDEGIIVPGSLHKEDLTEEKLYAFLREKGVDSIKDVRKAFIEADGEFSLIPYKNS